jgi:hypothetical protein
LLGNIVNGGEGREVMEVSLVDGEMKIKKFRKIGEGL